MRSEENVGAKLRDAGLRILILEDLPTDAELVERELRKADIEFVARRVVTREAFLQALDEFAPDILLADYHLPQFNGMSALQLARDRYPTIPVIIVTGALSEEAAVACMKAGADDYLMKDRLARLGPAVRGALERKREREARARAEAALRASEAHFRSLIENALDMITLVDSNGTVLYQSPSITRVLGYAPGEVIDRKAIDFVHPAEREDVALTLERAFAEPGTIHTWVTRVRHKDGSWRVVEFSGRANRFGDVQRAVVNSRDITGRQRAEEALQESETRFRSVAQSAPDAIVLADGAGKIVFWNEAAGRMFGYSEDEVLGKPLTLLLAARCGSGDALREEMERLRSAGQSEGVGKTITLSGLRKDGSQFPLEMSLGTWKAGDETSYVGITHDITERVRAEAKLRESRERLDLALRSAELGIWDWKVQADEVIVNEQWAAMLGYSPDEIEPGRAGRKELVHPEDWPRVTDALHQHLEGRTPYYECEYRLRTKTGGWRWVLDRGKVVEWDEDGRPLRATGTHLDITERKEVEEAHTRLATALEQVGEGIAITDSGGTIQYVNPAFERITGYSAAEAVRRDLQTLQSGHEDAVFGRASRPTPGEGDVWTSRSTNRRKDGTPYEEDQTISPIRDQQGETLGYVVVEERVREQARQIEELFLDGISILGMAVEARDPYTGDHLTRVARYALSTGAELRLDEGRMWRLWLSSLFHDVGKLAIPDSILNKPGPLTDEEYTLMKRHPELGVKIIEKISFLRPAAEGILHHQERWDGKGYPAGLEGTEIPIESRILAVSDAFDAMLTDRPYRKARAEAEAVAELERCAGAQFDPAVVEAFLRAHAKGFPVGSLPVPITPDRIYGERPQRR